MTETWICKRISNDNFGGDISRFHHTEALLLRQHWDDPTQLPQHQGICHIGYNDFGICFLAILNDSHIATTATQNNQKFWELGDTCEFFVKPGVAQSSYRETHVTPNNLKLEVLIPDRTNYLEHETPSFEEAVALGQSSCKHTVHSLSPTRWAAELWIPWHVFGCDKAPENSTQWQAACSRYSYPPNSTEPEYSSTANLTKLSFHRYEEFHLIVFQ